MQILSRVETALQNHQRPAAQRWYHYFGFGAPAAPLPEPLRVDDPFFASKLIVNLRAAGLMLDTHLLGEVVGLAKRHLERPSAAGFRGGMAQILLGTGNIVTETAENGAISMRAVGLGELPRVPRYADGD
jgi:hypothetical protein